MLGEMKGSSCIMWFDEFEKSLSKLDTTNLSNENYDDLAVEAYLQWYNSDEGRKVRMLESKNQRKVNLNNSHQSFKDKASEF